MIGRVFRGVITATLICTAEMVAPAGAVTIATTYVGDAGNPPDSTGYGAVPYGFDIGKFEITNDQYAEFLNAVDPTAQNPLGLWTLPMMTQPQGGIMASSIVGYSAKPGRGSQPAILVS